MRRRLPYLLFLLPAMLMGQSPGIVSYDCLWRHVDTERWLKEDNRRTDLRGILLSDNWYNPLGVSFYGILRYEDYRAGGNPAHKMAAVAQYAYFQDTALVTSVDGGRGLALPYWNDWKDLKAPWYSGMAQGAALSYLVRYHDLTGDTSAFGYMHRIAHVLLLPAREGGCLGRTPEGLPWLEEYPQSKAYPHVLNGFINAWIGLHEYCGLFPQRRDAAAMRDSCFQSLLRTIGEYNTPDWTEYKRVRGSVLQLHYMRYQLAQLAHIARIRPVPALERQAMIWAAQMHGRIDEHHHFYRMPKYQFGWDALAGDPRLVGDSAFARVLGACGTRLPAGEECRLPMALPHGATCMLTLDGAPEWVVLRFGDAGAAALVELQAFGAGGDSLATQVEWHGAEARLRTQAPMGRVRIRRVGKRKASAQLEAVQAVDFARQALPQYGFVFLQGRHALVQGQALALHVELAQVTGAVLFYRSMPLAGGTLTAVWDRDRCISLPAGEFRAPADGLYEFLLAFPIRQPGPRVMRAEAGR